MHEQGKKGQLWIYASSLIAALVGVIVILKNILATSVGPGEEDRGARTFVRWFTEDVTFVVAILIARRATRVDAFVDIWVVLGCTICGAIVAPVAMIVLLWLLLGDSIGSAFDDGVVLVVNFAVQVIAIYAILRLMGKCRACGGATKRESQMQEDGLQVPLAPMSASGSLSPGSFSTQRDWRSSLPQ